MYWRNGTEMVDIAKIEHITKTISAVEEYSIRFISGTTRNFSKKEGLSIMNLMVEYKDTIDYDGAL